MGFQFKTIIKLAICITVVGWLLSVWPVKAQTKIYCGQNGRYQITTINMLNCANSNGVSLDNVMILVEFPSGSYRGYIYNQNNTTLFNANVGTSSINNINVWYLWYENGNKVGLFDTIRLGTNTATTQRMKVYIASYTNTPMPTSTPLPANTPLPCGVKTDCLATVIAQLAQVITNQNQPMATPNIFTKTLPSGNKLTVSRRFSYGDVSASAGLITLLLFGISIIVWQGVRS